ncbi:hypothetical protein H9P43_008418 [Blastocladiella emersonii ATCC 22665]|nr:hypothetical protein H9P43_008418 [Blastocladiella emersonii ATCC 22665]
MVNFTIAAHRETVQQKREEREQQDNARQIQMHGRPAEGLAIYVPFDPSGNNSQAAVLKCVKTNVLDAAFAALFETLASSGALYIVDGLSQRANEDARVADLRSAMWAQRVGDLTVPNGLSLSTKYDLDQVFAQIAKWDRLAVRFDHDPSKVPPYRPILAFATPRCPAGISCPQNDAGRFEFDGIYFDGQPYGTPASFLAMILTSSGARDIIESNVHDAGLPYSARVKIGINRLVALLTPSTDAFGPYENVASLRGLEPESDADLEIERRSARVHACVVVVAYSHKHRPETKPRSEYARAAAAADAQMGPKTVGEQLDAAVFHAQADYRSHRCTIKNQQAKRRNKRAAHAAATLNVAQPGLDKRELRRHLREDTDVGYAVLQWCGLSWSVYKSHSSERTVYTAWDKSEPRIAFASTDLFSGQFPSLDDLFKAIGSTRIRVTDIIYSLPVTPECSSLPVEIDYPIQLPVQAPAAE